MKKNYNNTEYIKFNKREIVNYFNGVAEKDKGIFDKRIFEKVKNIIVEQLGVEPCEVNINTNLVDLGMDSLDVVELIMAFEEEFIIEIPDEVAERMRTVRDIVVYLGNR